MGVNNKPIILAIDDEAIILNSVLAIMGTNFSVKPFISGQTALKYLEKNHADLILLDYQMPNMTGLQVFDKIQENTNTSGIPVIFLTGAYGGDMEAELLERGAADFILKPIKPQVLTTRIHVQLELMGYRKRMETLVEEKTESLRIAYEKLKLREDVTLNMLAKVTDLRDHDTGTHIIRTTEFVRIIVNDLLSNKKDGYLVNDHEADDIIKSAKLHDLGKIAIPDEILLKKGKLTPDEFDVIKTHTTHGAYLLDEFISQIGNDSFLHTAKEIALSHQEKWNGTGYPNGLCGEDIPLSARIVAIADVYDALVSDRPYKKPFPHEKAVEIITKDAGTHFDPYLTEVFLRYEKDFEKITQSI